MNIKSWFLLSGALCAASLSFAQTEPPLPAPAAQPQPVQTPVVQSQPVPAAPAQGVVLSSTPIVQQVPVSRQVCSNQEVVVQQPKTGAGAAIGAVAGSIIGNVAGHGSGAATVLGAVGGAVIGDQAESAPAAQAQTVQRCGVQTFYENRTVGYRVIYTYANQQYTVQMPYDPGPTIALQVQPAQASVPAAPVQQDATVVTTTTMEAPTQVIVTTPTPYYYYLFGAPWWGGPGPRPHGYYGPHRP